jgi:hypothetical protein
VGDEPEQKWGSYPKYERLQPKVRTVEQQDKADADLAFLNAKAERGWNAQAQTDPLWRFKGLCALLARYELLNEYDWESVDERKKTIKAATARECKEHDAKLVANNYYARWLVSCFWGQDGLNRLDDKAKE